MLAWLPQQILFGKPSVLDVCVVSGKSVAEARDGHYHNPPDYLVIEPEDTTARTRNLQQTNTNGFKFQGSPEQFIEAQRMVEGWGSSFGDYSTNVEYQRLLRDLQGAFPYRLDTNFAKMDRIMHDGIEDFKQRVLSRDLFGLSIGEWNRLLYNRSETRKLVAINRILGG